MALDGRATVALKPGYAEAALFLELHTVSLDESRVDEGQQIRRVPAGRDIAHEDPEADANLRCRQSDARRRVHGVNHVVDQRLDFRCHVVDGRRGTVEDVGSVADYGTQHLLHSSLVLVLSATSFPSGLA